MHAWHNTHGTSWPKVLELLSRKLLIVKTTQWFYKYVFPEVQSNTPILSLVGMWTQWTSMHNMGGREDSDSVQADDSDQEDEDRQYQFS